MRVYLLRHGIAAERGADYPDDTLRPLTDRGRDKTRRCARGLLALGIDFDLVLASPLVRARETAEIVLHELALPDNRLQITRALEPGAPPADTLRAIPAAAGALDPAFTVLLVGHEPSLSHVVSWLLCGNPDAVAVLMKKAALCMVEVAPDILAVAPQRRSGAARERDSDDDEGDGPAWTGAAGRGLLRLLMQPAHLAAIGKARHR